MPYALRLHGCDRSRQLPRCPQDDQDAGRRLRCGGGFQRLHQNHSTKRNCIAPMKTNGTFKVEAEPYEFEFAPDACALVIIDMQRDFLEPGGFGEMLGNDVSQLRGTIAPNKRLLTAWRKKGWLVIHTREGHRPDLTDLPRAKKIRGRSKTCIGDAGPMGRILVRGEGGHDIIPELYPLKSEPVIDKPGKGAFFATDLHAILQHRGVKQLVVTGVTT